MLTSSSANASCATSGNKCLPASQSRESCGNNRLCVQFKVTAQMLAIVAASKVIHAERYRRPPATDTPRRTGYASHKYNFRHEEVPLPEIPRLSQDVMNSPMLGRLALPILSATVRECECFRSLNNL